MLKPTGDLSASGRMGSEVVEVGRVTLQTIAEHVGVSRMTVSNAFSRPDQLSEDLRARILTAADDLGYAGPDPAARALARAHRGHRNGPHQLPEGCVHRRRRRGVRARGGRLPRGRGVFPGAAALVSRQWRRPRP
ncbi:LacI family DNA-binding transcriptional regulator [Microbacterium sp. Se5.02b]|nr:LacI family DNA-binding transcriptional regulator [Microbacterium sp. Se5.02b]